MSAIDDFLNDTPSTAAPAGKPAKSAIDGFLADAPTQAKGFAGQAKDLGLSAVKSAIAVPELAVGLADMVTGGRAGKALENEGGAVGFRPKQAKEFLTSLQTEGLADQRKQFTDADGVLAKTGVALSNPSLIANSVVESLAPMGAGGLVGRGLVAVAPKIGAVGAGALGEGVVSAGSAAEQIRQETTDGLLTGKQTGLAAATALTTAAFGAAGGKVAKQLGIADVDTMLAQGAIKSAGTASTKGVTRQVIEGAIAEGLLEELPQSVSEQILQNFALDKPWQEGVDEAAVMGTLAGMAMGGPAAGLSALQSKETPATAPVPPAGPAPAPAAPGLGFNPGAGTHTVFPDGSVVLNSDTVAGEQAVFDKRYAPQDSDIQTWDTLKPGGSLTLYRGESEANDANGQWWTTDQAKAARYGKVQSVTLPVEVAASYSARGHNGADEFVFPTVGKRPLDLAQPAPPTPSAAMGINPAAGPISAAAALAVDSGAHDQANFEAAAAAAQDQAANAPPPNNNLLADAKTGAPVQQQQDGDLMSSDGKPFAIGFAAKRAAKAAGEGFTVVKLG